MKFTINRNTGIATLWSDEQKPLAATATIENFLAENAILKAPAGVPVDKWIIVKIAGGEENQRGEVYDDKASAKVAMLKMYGGA